MYPAFNGSNQGQIPNVQLNSPRDQGQTFFSAPVLRGSVAQPSFSREIRNQSTVNLSHSQPAGSYIQRFSGSTLIFDSNRMPDDLSGVLKSSYKANQNDFTERTNLVISTSKGIIETEAMGFRDFVQHLGRVRRDLASDSDADKFKFGAERSGTLRTCVIDERYYQLARKMISSLISCHNISPQLIQKMSRNSNYLGRLFPGCESASYDLYGNFYYSDQNHQPVLTTKVAVVGSDGFIPHQNGLPLLDCEANDINNIRVMYNYYSDLARKYGVQQANLLYHDLVHEVVGKRFRLQAIPREFSNSNYETWEIIHTPPENIPVLMKYAEEAFNNFQNFRCNNESLAFREVARCLWFFANACPFQRGSSWTTEVLGSTMLSTLPSYSNVGSNLIRANVDFLAFSMPIESFCDQFLSFLYEHASSVNLT